MRRMLLAIIFCLFSFNIARAVVADPNAKTVKQSDSTLTTVLLKGDERVSWAKTLDGYTLMHAQNSDFVYAVPDGKGGMIASKMIAHDRDKRTDREKAFIANLDTNLFYSKEQISLMKQYFEVKKDFVDRIKTKSVYDSNVNENYKMVVILMSFNDYAFTTPKDEIDNLFNQVGYSKGGHPGSVHDYFTASSCGQLNLSATVVGPYVADSSIYYYGEDGTVEYNGVSYDVKDKNVRALIREAVLKADNDINYAEYTNGDLQYVSCVYVIYAGYAQSSGNASYTIWPHRSAVYPPIDVDGVMVYDYGCSSEKYGTMGGYENTDLRIGTICHEFSHVLGQPDYYDTDYEENGDSFFPGEWDVMASGNYNGDGMFPPLWSAMERTVRNYINIIDVSNNNDYTLGDLQYTNKAYRLTFANSVNEYFIMENRQKTGFDSYLPGHGLIIYHVDKNVSGWNNNCANCVATDLGYSIVPANNVFYNYYTQAQPFPGSTNNNTFTDNSTPSSVAKDGTNLGKPLYRINENTITGNITFHVGDTIGIADIKPFTITFNADTAHLAATIASANSLPIIEKGFVVSSNNLVPTTNDTKYIVNNGNSTFTLDLNLNGSTTYYIRPYVIASGTSYGEVIKVKMPCNSINYFPFTEGFENGISDCYNRQYTSYIANDWKDVDSTNITGAIQIANSGQKFAYIHSDGTINQQIKLILPPMDLTLLDSPIIKFYHHQKETDNVFDCLKVYYKTSIDADWTILKTYNNNISSWQKDSILLPYASKMYFLAFESNVRGGFGIGLDDIEITDDNTASFPVVVMDSVSEITDMTAKFNAKVLYSGTSSIEERGFVYSVNPMPTLDDSILVYSSANLGSYNMVASNLESSTTYYVRAYAKNAALTVYSNQKEFTAKCSKIVSYPYTANINSGDTLCFDNQGIWQVDQEDESYYYESQTSDLTNKLILPIFDLSYQDTITLSFDYKQLSSNVNPLKVYYRSSVEDSWQLIGSFNQADNSYVQKSIVIPTLNHQSSTSYIAFEATSTIGGKVNIKNINLSTVSQIAFVSTDSAYLNSYNAIGVDCSIFYQGLSNVTQNGIVYSTSGVPTIADTKIISTNYNSTFTCNMTNLDPITTYYIRAYATNSFGTAYGETKVITTPYIPIFNNTITANQHLCAGTVPSQLNGSTPTGGSGTYEYLWVSSTDSINWDSCNEGSANGYIYYEPRQLFATRYYRRVVTSYLSVDTSNTVTINIDPETRAGNVFRLEDTVTLGDTVHMQLRAYTGNILYWERLDPYYDWQQLPNTIGSVNLADRPSDSGEYAYRAVVQSGLCPSAESGQERVYIKYTVSIDDNDLDNDFIVTPNPTSGKLYIVYGGLTQKVNIMVTDINSKPILRTQMNLTKGNNVLDLTSLSEGTYIVNIIGEYIQATKKVIISK